MLGYFNFKAFHNQWLITNDWGEYAFLNEKEFHRLLQDQPQTNTDLAQELSDRMFWTDESREAFIRRGEHSLRDAESYLFDGTTLFILAVTNECNNRCVYCQAHGTARPERMSVETAEKILRRIAECPTRAITIEFQGGEPFINFPVIRYVVEKAPEIMPEKTIGFTVVSNLLLMTDETADFLQAHHVSVSTSLDGPTALHDKNRPMENGRGSYAGLMKGLEILWKHQIAPGAIQTTTADSLQYPEEIIDTYLQLGFHQIFLRPLTRLGAAAQSWERIGYTPEAFLTFYRRALAYIIQKNLSGESLVEYHAALFLSKILRNRSFNYMELRSPCGASLGQMAFTASGGVYTCDEGRMMAEMGDESFRLGNVFQNGYEEWIASPCCKAVASASLLETIPGCCDCVYKPYCGVCPVVNYALNGNITTFAKDRCKIYAGILDILFEYLMEGKNEIVQLFMKWSDQI